MNNYATTRDQWCQWRINDALSTLEDRLAMVVTSVRDGLITRPEGAALGVDYILHAAAETAVFEKGLDPDDYYTDRRTVIVRTTL